MASVKEQSRSLSRFLLLFLVAQIVAQKGMYSRARSQADGQLSAYDRPGQALDLIVALQIGHPPRGEYQYAQSLRQTADPLHGVLVIVIRLIDEFPQIIYESTDLIVVSNKFLL